jgi:homoserine kinase type II
MSVFTPVSIDDARAFIATYDVGEIIDFQDIAAGVENSNFFVTTTRGRYVLTLFEKIPRDDLDFYMGLMAHLHGKNIPCASPIRNRDGTILSTLHEKPAALVARLRGGDIAHPTIVECDRVGAALAHMHEAAADFSLPMANWRGLAWWRREAVGLEALASSSEVALLKSEVAYQSEFDHLHLPRGIVHADLFRDNILWDEADHTPQMIDFYFACHEQLLWDVAITVNDWCVDFAVYPNAKLHDDKTRALLAGYASVRAFTPAERAAWPQMLRAAALRSWLGRLGYYYYPRASTLTHAKDHPFSERLLRYHIEQGDRSLALLPSLLPQ